MEVRRSHDIDSLTDVALQVFAARGYDGASMDDVARAAGISKASIYHHVAGKEALLERGLRRALDALFGILEESGATAGSALERLRFIVKRVAQTTLLMRPELSVLFRIRGNSRVERGALERRRRFDRLVAALVRMAQESGDVRRDIDAAVAVRLIFGMSNSVVEWYRSEGRVTEAGLADAIVALAFSGMSAR